jgi:hypothetical protein
MSMGQYKRVAVDVIYVFDQAVDVIYVFDQAVDESSCFL